MKNHMCIGCRSVSVDFWFTGQFTADTRPLQGDLANILLKIYDRHNRFQLRIAQYSGYSHMTTVTVMCSETVLKKPCSQQNQSCDNKIRHSNKSRRLWSCWPIFFFNIFPGSYSSVLISVIERWRTNRNLLIHKILLASPHPHPPKKNRKKERRGWSEEIHAHGVSDKFIWPHNLKAKLWAWDYLISIFKWTGQWKKESSIMKNQIGKESICFPA